jgi:pimeloyl-ACP methyl ester carboxylesterase
LAAALMAAFFVAPCLGQKIQMKDGRIYEGQLLPMTGVSDPPLAENGPDEEAPSTPILLIDDGLRRVFVPKANVAAILEEAPANPIKITLWQNKAQAGSTLASVGPSLGITPFDKFGRRVYEMQTRDGPLAIVQGITELTPRYAKVEGLIGQPRTIVWDMRLATSSIPRDTLAEILATAVSREDPQDWLQIVRFYLQGEHYGEALDELEAIIAAHPDKQDLKDVAKELRREGANRILREIELRRQAGQHELAGRLLENFPAEDVPGETLQQVREALADYQADKDRLKTTAAQLRTLLAELKANDTRAVLKPVVEEMLKRLSVNNVGRLTPFSQLADDASLAAEQKLALAVSGWILGPNDAVPDLSVALAMVTVRQVVHDYLNEPLAHERTDLLDSIRTLQGVTVPRVASIIANLTPPWEIPKEASQGQGAYDLTAPGHTEDGDFHYLAQTPPEYDPDRRYPTLLVLNGSTNSPRQELEFWAGNQPTDEEGKPTGPRVGQAMRHGYLVIAVDWLKPKQYTYEYSFREHAAVLTTLRDACRRFSIDTDRVFLSGHGIGGEAAWDLAQAHPDLWAGVLPFVAQFSQKEKFVQHYWDNAAYVPLYFVCGELDSLKMSLNAQLLDPYLKKRFPTTIVEFHGRGYEPFHDAILECFDWLDRQTREWPPKDFECNTMRAWDNFFWWVEGQGFPDAITPGNWPRRNARPTVVEGRVLNGNRLSARTACDQTLLWLRPDMVDFNQTIRVTLNGNRVKGDTTPSLEVLLEDTRTRADRQRPFWAKLQVP